MQLQESFSDAFVTRSERVIYSEGFARYDGLVDVWYDTHFRVDHGNHEFACGHCHINAMKEVLAVAKTRRSTFCAMSKATFYLCLKGMRIALQ